MLFYPLIWLSITELYDLYERSVEYRYVEFYSDFINVKRIGVWGEKYSTLYIKFNKRVVSRQDLSNDGNQCFGACNRNNPKRLLEFGTD